MGLGTKVYVGILLLGGAAFAAPEVMPRPDRGYGATDLRRSIRVVVEQYDGAELRLRSGHARLGDDEMQINSRARLTDLRREAILRDLQTGSLLLVTVSSLVFAAFGMRRGLRRKSGPTGIVEIAADQTVKVSPETLGSAMSALAHSRADAIVRLRTIPALRCRSCARPSHWKVLGRIGRRIFVKAGADPDARPEVLSEGWWFRGMPPEPCSKCGSDQTVEA